ncbi:alpha/beta-hydrolase, partial [Canariomyces notabilis]
RLNLPGHFDKGCPIVLVPGFSGWGRPLLGTLNYFGGFSDLASALSTDGYTVVLVRIGPISSNRERACEIYEQLTRIRGFDLPGSTPPTMINLDLGTGLLLPRGAPAPQTPLAVVYGADHLPQSWTWSDTNRVNFICHSQGDTTVRYLIWLLSGGGEPNLPQFRGVDRRPWVKAVVTLGTPHKGTPVTEVIESWTKFITSCSFASREDRFYDLHLDHWGFARRNLESYHHMRARIATDVQAWWDNNTTSNGFRDNSIEGAGYLNGEERGFTHPIYFFTMSFCATQPLPDLSLTDEDVNDFLSLFRPVLKILDPLGFGAWAARKLVPKIEPFTRCIGLTPPFQAVLEFCI